MTPAARAQAAIEILDQILSEAPAERALTRWARASRFAGSKDRAAVRDLVFDALRRRDSYAWAGGVLSGRGLMLGRVLSEGGDPAEVFSGQGHAPGALGEGELAAIRDPATAPEAVRLDLPDWTVPHFREGLGADWARIAALFRDRAPVDLRVNTLKGDLETARVQLGAEGIETETLDAVPTALRVTGGGRQVNRSAPFLSGLVEVQDASSQAAILACAPERGQSVLDYCAGGGGKALALAALTGGPVHVHDIQPERMRDIPERAARAGACCPAWDGTGAFDLVFVDAPCSGSGTWRRTPDAKWRLTEARLSELSALQADILAQAARHVVQSGRLAFATCSVFRAENEAVINAFVGSNPGWTVDASRRFGPLTHGDGFFLALLSRR